ncbi:MAG TPA: molybdopterin-dependent oxidoreductase [Acidobacteriota bacterium]|nr:molybdopterin-dependent oxidoreductase [Acidobacteriota bacterium]
MRSSLKTMASISRRLFMFLSGGILLVAALPSTLSASFLKKLPVRTVEKDKFTFDPDRGLIEWQKKKEPYRLIIDGLVRKPRSFSYADIRSFPRVEQTSDLHCVEGWSVKDLRWSGFRFGEVLKRVDPDPDATHVLFHSFGATKSSPRGQNHYIESFPISELLDPEREILLALTLDGRTLPEEHGAPLRLAAPHDLAYKSSKFITRIEFIKNERPGWWTLANPAYPVVARVPESRLRHN